MINFKENVLYQESGKESKVYGSYLYALGTKENLWINQSV